MIYNELVLFHKYSLLESTDLFEDDFTENQLKQHKKLIKPIKLNDRDKNELGNYSTTSNSLNLTHWLKKLGTHPDIKNREPDHDVNDDLKKTHIINSILDKLPSSDKDLTVYSGLTHHANLSEILKNGGILHVPSFMSTSLSPKIASQFATGHRKTGHGDIIAIHIPKNTHEGGYISPYSILQREREFLLKSNKLLKFKSTPDIVQQNEKGYGKSNYHIYHAHIMNSQEISENIDHPEVKSYLNYKF